MPDRSPAPNGGLPSFADLVAMIQARLGIAGLDPVEDVIQTHCAHLRDLITAVREQQAALLNAVPDDIEDTCTECNGGPCVGCWVLSARATLAKWRIE